jgi:hypothetical protein
MLNYGLSVSPAIEELVLEKCPEAIQVMPPETSRKDIPLSLRVLGNVVMGVLLLGGLFLAPYWIASLAFQV